MPLLGAPVSDVSTHDYLRGCHNDAAGWLSKLTFDSSHPWHRNLIALLGSIIELSEALAVLAENNCWIGIKPLMRTLLEHFVEIKNLSEAEEYGFYMEASYFEQWLKVLNHAKDSNPYLCGIANLENLEVEVSKHRDILADLHSNGYEPKSVYDKFKMAGLENEYRSVYNSLSAESHGNIRALIGRHFDIDRESGKVQLVVHRDASPGEYDHYLTHAARLLLLSSLYVQRVMEGNTVNEIEKSITSLDFYERAIFS